jgi:hypothetical protein
LECGEEIEDCENELQKYKKLNEILMKVKESMVMHDESNGLTNVVGGQE